MPSSPDELKMLSTQVVEMKITIRTLQGEEGVGVIAEVEEVQVGAVAGEVVETSTNIHITGHKTQHLEVLVLFATSWVTLPEHAHRISHENPRKETLLKLVVKGVISFMRLTLH